MGRGSSRLSRSTRARPTLGLPQVHLPPPTPPWMLAFPRIPSGRIYGSTSADSRVVKYPTKPNPTLTEFQISPPPRRHAPETTDLSRRVRDTANRNPVSPCGNSNIRFPFWMQETVNRLTAIHRLWGVRFWTFIFIDLKWLNWNRDLLDISNFFSFSFFSHIFWIACLEYPMICLFLLSFIFK